MADTTGAPVKVEVEVGIDGGTKFSSKSIQPIKSALDALVSELGNGKYDIPIGVRLEKTDVVQKKIQEQLDKISGLSVKITPVVDGEPVQIKGNTGSSSSKSESKEVTASVKSEKDAKSSSIAAPAIAGKKAKAPAFTEEELAESVKKAQKEISSQVKTIITQSGAASYINKYEKSEDKQNTLGKIINAVQKAIDGIENYSEKLNSSGFQGALDGKNTKLDIARNTMLKEIGYIGTKNDGLDPKEEYGYIGNPKTFALEGTLNQFKNITESLSVGISSLNETELDEAFKSLGRIVDELNIFAVSVSPDHWVSGDVSKIRKTITNGARILPDDEEPVAESETKSSSEAVAGTDSAVAADVKTIAEAVSSGNAIPAPANEPANIVQSVSIDPTSIQALTDKLTEVVLAISEASQAKTSAEASPAVPLKESADIAGENKSATLEPIMPEIKLSPEFETTLTEQLSSAIYNAMLQATAQGGGIREAMVDALSSLSGLGISSESIDKIVNTVQGIEIPTPVVNVPTPVVNITQNDYTDTLNKIAENTTPKEDSSSAILNEIPGKVASGVAEALKGINITQVHTGSGTSGANSGTSNSEKTQNSSSNKEGTDGSKAQKDNEPVSKKEKSISPTGERIYNRIKELIKERNGLYETLYEMYSLGKPAEAKNNILNKLNDTEFKIQYNKNAIRDKGYSDDSFDKEISEFETKSENDRKALEKKYIEGFIKERIGLQKQLNELTLKNMKIDSSTEKYAANEIKKNELTKRISFIDSGIIDSFNSSGSYNDEVNKFRTELAQINEEFDSRKKHIENQTDAYSQLRAAVEALTNAQTELDKTSITGDTIQISEKQNAVDTAKANIEEWKKYIRENNLTSDSLETGITKYGKDKQFERLNNATKEYFNAKAELAKMGATEAGKQSAEYKELENRVRRLAEVETKAYDELNQGNTRNDSRFKQWNRERNVLQSTVALEKNRSMALQDINNWEVKNRRAAEEYKQEIDAIVEGLKDASDATSVDNLKASFGGIKAEATSRGLTGRNETKQELEANMATAKSLQQKLQDLLRKADVKAFKEYQQEIDSAKAAINEAMGSGTKDSLKEARRQLSELTSDFKSAGYAGGNMFTALDKKVRGLFQLFMSGSVIGQIKQQFTDAYHSVMNLDNAFATIRMTMEASNAEMKQLADESINLSKELGVSLESVTSAAAIYANQNISTAEIIERSKPTALLASAADMSSSAAADLVQGALYQFEMDDSVDNLNRIVDAVEKISASTGVEFKRSIEQISEGIQTTGAMAHEAGFSIEQYAALVGGLVEKTRRSGSEVANGLKMIFARLGQNREGEATEEEISKAEKAYKSIGISLRDGTDNFRDLPEVFDELNAKWSTLTDVQKAYIAEISAGNRNRSLFMAAMNNYDTVKSLTTDAMNAEGFAAEANEERMDSFEAKLGQVKAAAEGFWNNFVNTDIIKSGLDFSTGVVDFLDQVINKLPVISQLSRTLIALLAVKAFPSFVQEMSESDSAMGVIARTLKNIIPNFKEFKQTVENFKNINANSSIEDIAKAFEGIGSDETKTALARYVGITDEQIEAVRNRLRETAEEISNETDDGGSDESNPISDAVDNGREVAEQAGEALENITQNIQDANADMAVSTQEAAQNVAQQAQAVDGLAAANQQEAVASADNVAAQQAQTAARTAGTTATAAQISAENANTGATNASTAANAANSASQLTLLGGIKAVTKGLLAQAAAWAATPVGIITIAVTAVAGLANVVNSINESIDESREKIKETQKEASEAVEKYRSDTDDLKSSEDRVVSLSNKYRKLSKGVSENGYRVSLTREEYEEYKEVVNEIAKENDQLIKGYNLEGLALLDLGDTIDDTRKKYEELRKEKAKAFVEENTDKILEANKGQYEDGDYMSASENIVETRNLMNGLADVYQSDNINRAYIEFEAKYSQFYGESKFKDIMSRIADKMNYGSSKNLEDKLSDGSFSLEKLTGLISEYDNTISNARDGVNKLISSKLLLSDEYSELSYSQKSFIDNIMSELLNDDDFYYQLYRENISTSETVAFIISAATDSELSGIMTARKKFQEQYEAGKITLNEYKNNVSELKNNVAEILGETTISTAVASLFDTSQEEERRKKALDSLRNQSAEILSALGDKIISSGDLYNFENKMNRFTTEDLEIIARIDVNPEWSEEDLRDEIRYEKIRMRNVAMSEFNFLDSAYKSDIETFTSTISKLESALKSVDTMSAEDLLDLMMQFSDFDWKSFGVTGEVGVGNVSGAIRQLIDKALSDLIDTFGDVNSSQIKVFTDMADNAKKAAEKIEDVSDAMNGLKSAYDTLKSVQKDIAKYGRIGIDTVADIIDEYPELADEGAAYISGKISVDEFMKEYKKSYDKVFKEKQQYIYRKALENPDVRKDYEAYISAKKASEIDAETQALISSESNRIRTRAEAEAKAIYTGLSKTYGSYYDEQSQTIDTEAMRKAGRSGQDVAYASSVVESAKQKAKEILDNANAEIDLLPINIEKTKQESLFALWEKMKDEYNVDLGAYSTYAEAKEHINARVEESLSSLTEKYSDFYDEQTQKLDIEAMSKAGYSGQDIAYAMSIVEKAKQKRTEVQNLTKDIENYYKSSNTLPADFVDKVAYLYDIDVNNCKSYAEAKAKIYKQLLKMNMKLISFMGDDVKQVEILKDLIDEDTGEFDAGKAITKYKVGQNVVIELMKASDTYKEILKTVEELGEIDLDNIDPSFFEDMNLESVEDEAEKLNELLSEMISLYDMVFDGIQAVADKRIETLEKEREALEDKNEEENREIELIKARQQLEDAKNNKNVRVYYEGKGFVWEADKTAIAEAEENLKDKELEAKTAVIDKEIDALNEYKEQFANISSNIEDEKNISAAMRQLGVNDPGKLLQISGEIFKSLESNYRSLSLANDKQENLDKLTQYTPMTDEQIREKFGSNFGIPLDSLRNYWSGAYFIPDTIRQYMETEKKALQTLTSTSSDMSSAGENKNTYIDKIIVYYSGNSIDDVLKSAERLSKVM